ncbi:MAG: hypothetical protein V1863_01270 [Candidatus Omnitrophota bacterium]
MGYAKVKKQGQSSLELTAALVVIFILLIASVKIFTWLNERIVVRQVRYEATRVEFGDIPPTSVALMPLPDVGPEGLKILASEVIVNESDVEALDLFE